MKTSTHLTSRTLATALVLGAAALAWALPARAASNCSQRLNFDEVYECEFRGQGSSAVTEGSLLFEQLGGDTFTATLDLEGAMSLGYCTCKTKPQNSPGFGKSKSFECVTALPGGAVETMEGAVIGNGDKISAGQVWSVDPVLPSFLRLAFSCGKAGKPNDDGEGDPDDPDDPDDGNDDGTDDGNGGNPNTAPLAVSVQPTQWNTKWLEKGGGTVSAQFRGEGFDLVAAGSILLTGSDPAAAPLAPVKVQRRGNRLEAQFDRGGAMKTLLAPKKGETHSIVVDFEVDGVAMTSAFDVRITGK